MLELDKISLVWIMMPFFIGGVVYTKIVRHKTGDPLRDSVKNLQVMITVTAVVLVVLLFSLSPTAVLGSFGYPHELEDINNQEKLLELLQDYNKAIVRTTEVVYWLLFISVFWILTAVYQLLKVYKDKLDKETAKQYETTN